MNNRGKLFATPNSHFARKVRILLAELEIPFELVFVPNLLSSDPADFGGNPILRIPTWLDGEQWIVESDQIARYIVETHAPADRLRCTRLTPSQRNALTMINAAMGAEVEILLSGRSGIEQIQSYDYFRRYYDVIRHCLDWLESAGSKTWTPAESFSYLDLTLICMWDHLRFYGTIQDLTPYSWVADRVARFAARPSVDPSVPTDI